MNNYVNLHGSDGLSGLTVAELTGLLRSRGLQTNGRKRTLLKRLRKHLKGMLFNLPGAMHGSMHCQFQVYHVKRLYKAI